MNYIIVWNENKTEGIILSGEDAASNAKYATTGKCSAGWFSSISSEFYEIYGQDGCCTIQKVEEIK